MKILISEKLKEILPEDKARFMVRKTLEHLGQLNYDISNAAYRHHYTLSNKYYDNIELRTPIVLSITKNDKNEILVTIKAKDEYPGII